MNVVVVVVVVIAIIMNLRLFLSRASDDNLWNVRNGQLDAPAVEHL